MFNGLFLDQIKLIFASYAKNLVLTGNLIVLRIFPRGAVKFCLQ